MSQNLSQSVCSQTEIYKNAQDKAFITPYLASARKMFQEINDKEKAKDEMKKQKKEKLRKSSEIRIEVSKTATKRTSDNISNDSDGGKSQPLSTDDHFTTSSKKKKKDIECLSLSLSNSDLDDYGTSGDESSSSFGIEKLDDSGAIFIRSSENDDIYSDTSNCRDYSSSNKSNCSSSSSSSSDSSGSGDSSSSQESVDSTKKKPKNTSIEAKILSDYKRNNKNGRKVIDISSESDDEETDDGTEAHVVCLICGKYNTKKKLYLWISCKTCKNWYHKDCTDLWRKNIKDIQRDDFLCRHCTPKSKSQQNDHSQSNESFK